MLVAPVEREKRRRTREQLEIIECLSFSRSPTAFFGLFLPPWTGAAPTRSIAMYESRGTTPNYGGHSSPNSQTNRAHSYYDDSDEDHDDDDHDDSPAELNEYEMDPINSGAATPRRVNHRGMPLDTVGQAKNFLGNSKSLKRESKVSWRQGGLELS